MRMCAVALHIPGSSVKILVPKLIIQVPKLIIQVPKLIIQVPNLIIQVLVLSL